MKLFFVVVFFIAHAANAGIYTWKDTNGNTHYSDQPLDQGKSTELHIDTEPRAGITNSSRDKKERDRMIRELENDRKERAEKRDKSRAAQQKKQKRCARAKDDLRRYQNAGGIYKLNDKGERVYYSRKERKAKEQRLSKKIAKACR